MKQVATKELVWSACRSMEKEGEEITTRKVVARTGGSTSTVGQLIRGYKEFKHKERSLNYVLSDNLRNVIVEELHQFVTQATEDLEKSLNSVQKDAQETLEDLSQAEHKINELEILLAETAQKTESEVRTKENELAAASQQIQDLNETLSREQLEKKNMQKEMTTCQSKLTKVLYRNEQVEKSLQAISEENIALKKSMEGALSDCLDLRRQLETAAERLEMSQNRQKELKSDLKQTAHHLDQERERRITAEKQLAKLEVLMGKQLSFNETMDTQSD